MFKVYIVWEYKPIELQLYVGTDLSQVTSFYYDTPKLEWCLNIPNRTREK